MDNTGLVHRISGHNRLGHGVGTDGSCSSEHLEPTDEMPNIAHEPDDNDADFNPLEQTEFQRWDINKRPGPCCRASVNRSSTSFNNPWFGKRPITTAGVPSTLWAFQELGLHGNGSAGKI